MNLEFLGFVSLIITTLLVPGMEGNLMNQNDGATGNMVMDVESLFNRLNLLEVKMENIKENHQMEINLLKKKNVELEKELRSLQNEKSASTDKNEMIENRLSRNISPRTSLPRSCYEAKASDPTAQSGMYYIDPDGQVNGDAPIYVHCDMDTRTTSVLHDTEEKMAVTNCADPGCYTRTVKYNATLRQMTTLAEISAECQQYVRYDCLSAPFEFSDDQYSYWHDRNGVQRYFWAGPETSSHTCQCGIVDRCVETDVKCNCDSLAPIPLFDEGFITAKNVLPVTQLSFGHTSLTGVSGSHTLGRFQCSGQAPIGNGSPENCKDLFKIGHTLSGYYNVKSGNKIVSTYCNFDKSPLDTGFETRIGPINIKSSVVEFYVARSGQYGTAGQKITFSSQILNVGNAFDWNNQWFLAPRNGTYYFSISGSKASNLKDRASITPRLNGNNIGEALSSADNLNYGGFSLQFTRKLLAGDKIELYMLAGQTHLLYFTGWLLDEDLILS